MPPEADPVVIALGVGCRRDCPPDDAMGLAMATLALAGLSLNQVTLVATLVDRQHETAIALLAEACQCPLIALPADALRESEPAMSQVSEAAWRIHDVPGVAEAAALAAIRQHTGATARLLINRQQCARATCALAIPASVMAPTE